MRLEEALCITASVTPEKLASFSKHLDAEWLEEALLATGAATIRRRRLPAEQVIWLVVGRALMRDLPIVDVVRQLDLVLPGSGGPFPQCRLRAVSAMREHAWARLPSSGSSFEARASTPTKAPGVIDGEAWRSMGSTVRRCGCPTAKSIAHTLAGKTLVQVAATAGTP